MAQHPGRAWAFYAAIAADNLCQGFAGVVLVAFMSSLTNRSYTATQYALLVSLANLPGKVLGGVSGVHRRSDARYSTFFIAQHAAVMPTPAAAGMAVAADPRPRRRVADAADARPARCPCGARESVGHGCGKERTMTDIVLRDIDAVLADRISCIGEQRGWADARHPAAPCSSRACTPAKAGALVHLDDREADALAAGDRGAGTGAGRRRVRPDRADVRRAATSSDAA